MSIKQLLKPKNIFDVRRELLSMSDNKNKFVVIDEYNTVEIFGKQWRNISEPITYHKAVEIKTIILKNHRSYNPMNFNSDIYIITWKDYVDKLTKDELKKLRKSK